MRDYFSDIFRDFAGNSLDKRRIRVYFIKYRFDLEPVFSSKVKSCDESAADGACLALAEEKSKKLRKSV